MTIWRGEGGGGDATTDSEINFITSLTNSIVENTATTTAAASATAALYDSFDDRYLGSKTAAPTLDNDGNSLISGALYWNSVSNQMFVWSGVAWQQTFFSGINARSVVTATAGQTVVTAPTYTLNNNTIQVYVNGFKVISGTDYTETSTTSITFASGLTLGDKVEIVVAQPFSVGTTSASSVSYIPSGTLSSLTAQDAIDELASEKVQNATLAASSGSSLVGYLPSGTGAVASTVQTKLRESVSVKDFGAVGDGVTDDSAAIQSAIEAVRMVGGGVVNIPAGTFIANGLVLYSSISLVGAGSRSTFLKPNATDNTKLISIYPLSLAPPAEGLQSFINIRGLFLSGVATKATTSNQHGIWIEPALLGVADSTPTIGISNVVIEDVQVVSMSGRGLHCRAQSYASPALERYVQGVITKNVVLRTCGQSGLFIQGLVIECDFSTLTISSNGATTSATLADKFNSNLVIAADGRVASPSTEGDMSYPARLSFRNGLLGDPIKGASATCVNSYITGGRQLKFDVCDMEEVYIGFLMEPHWPALPYLQAVKDVTFDTISIEENVIPRSSAIKIVNAVNVNVRNVKTNGSATSTDVYVNQTSTAYVQSVYVEPSCLLKGATPVTDSRSIPLASGVLKLSQAGDNVVIGSGGVSGTCTSITVDTASLTLRNNLEFCIRSGMTTASTLTFNKATLAAATIPVYLNSNLVLNGKGSLTLLYDKTLAAFVEKSRAVNERGTTIYPASLATTADVSLGQGFIQTGNASATNFATVTGGVDGQEVAFYFGDAFTTIIHGTGANSIYLKSKVSTLYQAASTLRIKYLGGAGRWFEV